MKHGNYLTVAVIVYDPVYLTEPFIRTTDFVYAPQQQMAPWPCEPVDEVDRPPGVVPHHLPGANTFLDEFPANYGIPAAGHARRRRNDVPGVHAENEDHGGAAAARRRRRRRHDALQWYAPAGMGWLAAAALRARQRHRAPAGPAPAPAEVHILPVQGNISMLVGAGGNITVQTGSDGVLLVDTGLAPMSDKVLAAVRSLSDKPIRYIINTHVHAGSCRRQ